MIVSPFKPRATLIAMSISAVSGGALAVAIATGALHVASPLHHVFGHHASLILSLASAISAITALVAGYGQSPVGAYAARAKQPTAVPDSTSSPPPKISIETALAFVPLPLELRRIERQIPMSTTAPWLVAAKLAAFDRILADASSATPVVNTAEDAAAFYAHQQLLSDMKAFRASTLDEPSAPPSVN